MLGLHSHIGNNWLELRSGQQFEMGHVLSTATVSTTPCGIPITKRISCQLLQYLHCYFPYSILKRKQTSSVPISL